MYKICLSEYATGHPWNDDGHFTTSLKVLCGSPSIKRLPDCSVLKTPTVSWLSTCFTITGYFD